MWRPGWIPQWPRPTPGEIEDGEIFNAGGQPSLMDGGQWKEFAFQEDLSDSLIIGSTQVAWATRIIIPTNKSLMAVLTPEGTRLNESLPTDFQIGPHHFNERGVSYGVTELEDRQRLKFSLPDSQGVWPSGTEMHLMAYLEDKEIVVIILGKSGPKAPWDLAFEHVGGWRW